MSNSLNQGYQRECFNATPIIFSTLCKGCNVLFNELLILNHISHSKPCKALYSDEEIREYEKWTKRRSNQAKSERHKKSYDPVKRAQLYQQNKAKILQRKAKKYYDTISKFKEKLKDRVSLKGQCFIKIYKKAYTEACNKFFARICKKAHQFLIENYLKDVNEEILKYTLWGKTVEENFVNIAKYLAKNSWDNPHQPEFQIEARLNGKFKDFVYKEAFANFYHNEIFVSTYNESYDHCLDHIMTSYLETLYSESGYVEEHCNKIFEKRVLTDIVDKSKESVVENISIFLEEEFEHVIKIDETKQNAWRRWLEHNRQSWGHILNVSGYTLVR